MIRHVLADDVRSDARFLPPDVPGFRYGILQTVGFLFVGGAAVGLIAGWGLLERQPWEHAAIVLGAFSRA